jgi:Tfp pilus assembly protein PilO
MDIRSLIKINLRKKIIIAAVLFPLGIGSIVYFVVIPTVNDIKSIRNEIEAQRIDLEIKYKKGQSIKQLTENLKIIEPQISKLEQIFISNDEVLEFITTLEEAANEKNVSQKINLATSKSVKEESYQKTPLQIITNGGFIKQLNYLISLEALNYYINIKSLELTAGSPRSINSGGQTKESSINMLLFADTYWK